MKARKCTQKWFNYRAISPNVFIQHGETCNAAANERASSARCAVAVTLSHLMDPGDWTARSIDRVLEDGDKLYWTVRTRLKLRDKDRFRMSLLPKSFYVFDHKVQIASDGQKGKNLSTASTEDLYEGLKEFFKSANGGVLTLGENSVALWNRSHDPGTFFYFDPGPCDLQGRRVFDDVDIGAACVVRIKELITLAAIVEESFLDGRSVTDGAIEELVLKDAKPIKSRLLGSSALTSIGQ